MTHRTTLIITTCLTLLAWPTIGRAAEDFRASIRAGEAANAAGDHAAAIAEFDEALIQAKNNTDRGIALSKKGDVLAYKLNEYGPALELAETALELDGAHAVARVMALRVKAHSLMQIKRNKPRAERDFSLAQSAIEQGLALEGVAWARPGLGLMLGDCHRFAGQFEEALAAFEAVPEMEAASDGVKAVSHLNRGLTYQYSLRATSVQPEHPTRFPSPAGHLAVIRGHLLAKAA